MDDLRFGPIYIKQKVYPKHLNLTFSVLHKYYLDDLKKWIILNKKELLQNFNTDKITPKIYNDILKKPYSVLTKSLWKKMLAYNGKLREYTDTLSDHLIKLHDEKNHPIFGPNYDVREILTELIHFNDENTESSILFEDPNYPGDKFLNSINRVSSIINQWFPEVYDCLITGNQLTLIDQVRDKNIFYHRLHRIVGMDKFNLEKISNNDKISTVLRTYFKVTNGNQIAYNFPLPLAKWIYKNVLTKKKFQNENEIYIADMSMGWGGRLAGMMSSLWPNSEFPKPNRNKIYHYWGTDVNLTIKDRYKLLYDFWKENLDQSLPLEIYTSTVGAENIFSDDNFAKMKGKFHFMFTSPPYFNKERYSDDETQSYLKYPKYENWVEGFLNPMIQNVYELLKPGGECWINIADVKKPDERCVYDKNTNERYYGKIKKENKDKYKIVYEKKYFNIQKATIDAAKKAGFKYKGHYKMIFGVVVGTRRSDKTSLTQNEIKISFDVKNISKSNWSNVDISKSKQTKMYKWEPILVFIKD